MPFHVVSVEKTMKLFIVTEAISEGFAYPRLCKLLRDAGHEILDLDFSASLITWGYIDPKYQTWSPLEYIEALKNPELRMHYSNIQQVMEEAEGCVLLLPASTASHMIAGWFVGQGKPLFVVLLRPEDPNIMHLLANSVTMGTVALGEALNEAAQEELAKKRFYDFLKPMYKVTGRIELTADGAWVHTQQFVHNDDFLGED
jgi:hypothetical protein